VGDVASCWIYEYIRILLGARPILHISRIKVKRYVDNTKNKRQELMLETQMCVLN
jgi:hypothetical protein